MNKWRCTLNLAEYWATSVDHFKGLVTILTIADNWVPVSRALPTEIPADGVDRTWPESERVLVRVSRQDHEPYPAFAVLRRDKWHIEGHTGDFQDCVTHWLPILLPQGD